jgi:hypothetical protein
LITNAAGEFTPGKYGEWRFDKRTWGGKPITRKLGDPPKNMKNDLVRALINSFNEATDAIPCWDKYAETGQVSCSYSGSDTNTVLLQLTFEHWAGAKSGLSVLISAWMAAALQVPKQCDEAPKHFLAEEAAAKKAGGTA